MDTPAKIEQFKEFLSEQGMKFTRQRRVIAEVFFEEGQDHPTLLDLLERSKKRYDSIGYATVYRTMKLMASSGLAIEHKFSDSGHAQYEPAEDGEHHDHLICMRCGSITEFEDEEIEQLQDAIARRHGFRVLDHRHEIYGVCSDCTAKEPRRKQAV